MAAVMQWIAGLRSAKELVPRWIARPLSADRVVSISTEIHKKHVFG
jgi:hypothetical protein